MYNLKNNKVKDNFYQQHNYELLGKLFTRGDKIRGANTQLGGSYFAKRGPLSGHQILTLLKKDKMIENMYHISQNRDTICAHNSDVIFNKSVRIY